MISRQHEYGPEDFENPEAPEDDRRLRADHLDVRDLSYDQTRTRQAWDLTKASLFDMDLDGMKPELDPGQWPKERLEVYIKRRPRGPGYVADFVYLSKDLPVRVYGILATRGQGLEIAELELWTLRWRDDGDPDREGDADEAADVGKPKRGVYPGPPITSDLLRRIPLGRILAKAQSKLAQTDWRDEGVTTLGITGPTDVPVTEMAADELGALETAAAAAVPRRRGRPSLPDTLLEQVARAYLEESVAGPGLTRRLATRFNRPEATISDWIAAARERQFLTRAAAGRRGAGAGPRLGFRPSAE